MLSLPHNSILKFNEDTLEAVRRKFNLEKPGAMNDAVNILEEWIKKQNHFTKKRFDRRYLETTIVLSKGSIEVAKSRLDRACTFRTLRPDLFCVYDIRHFYDTALKDVRQSIFPKMTKDHERVFLARYVAKAFESNIATSYIRTLPAFCEYLRLNDYSVRNVLVIDLLDGNIMDAVPKIKLSDAQQMVTFMLKSCGFRVKALYFISSSKLIQTVVAFTKLLLSAKLSERVHILQDRESLLQYIDKDILPKEYGGNERSLEELHEELLDALTSEEQVKYFKEISSAKTDESLRPRDSFNHLYMGMPGSFRVLTVD